MIKRIIPAILLCVGAVAFAAKPIDEAKAAYNAGEYADAAARLEAILKKTPKDATANYYMGLAQLALGNTPQAVPALRKAEDRGVADASRLLADIALADYDVITAEEHLDTYDTLLRKNKKAAPESLAETRSRLVTIKNMLERVEKIVIIDSVVVDKADFFKAYALSPEAGRLLEGSSLPPQYSVSDPSVVYRPENGKEVFWSMPDAAGALQIVSAGILDDGTMEEPRALGDELSEGGNADFPFLMADGVTLYFANNGENSLGGYDIFLSRRDTDGSVLQPQNIGMPFNSPFDDYMLAIDETRGVGYWATDRNQIPGKVTIYTYLPSDTRVNCSPDDPDIADRAFIRSIKATQEPGKDYSSYLKAPAQTAPVAAESEFAISMGNGKVYTALGDFKNPQARDAMEQYLDRRAELARMEQRLAALRKSYADGNHGIASDILELERRTLAARSMLTRLRNTVIRIETK